MSELRNCNVLITGAASGLGSLLAQNLGGRGGNLILLDVNARGLESVCNKLEENGVTAHQYPCDLTDRRAIHATVERVLADCGHVDILINNAGIVSGKSLMEISDEAIERTIQVNTLALFWLTRAVLPGMIERNRGHIVTIASAGGLVGTSRLTDYCASKFAAVGFDESVRLEMKRLGLNIKTTVVCPFYIDTGMFAGVKTRFPLLLPILKPEYAVKKIIRAIQEDRQRLLMPRMVYTVNPLRLLPVSLFDAVVEFFGVNKSMDEFTGRNVNEEKAAENQRAETV